MEKDFCPDPSPGPTPDPKYLYRIEEDCNVVSLKDIPAGETRIPSNLCLHGDEDWNKWYSKGEHPSEITIQTKSGKDVNAIGFRSAADSPNLDPAHVAFGYFNPTDGEKVYVGDYWEFHFDERL